MIRRSKMETKAHLSCWSHDMTVSTFMRSWRSVSTFNWNAIWEIFFFFFCKPTYCYHPRVHYYLKKKKEKRKVFYSSNKTAVSRWFEMTYHLVLYIDMVIVCHYYRNANLCNNHATIPPVIWLAAGTAVGAAVIANDRKPCDRLDLRIQQHCGIKASY